MQSNLWRSGSSLDLASEESQQLPAEGKLRRVFTAQARRRTSRRKNEAVSKDCLRVAHSVPLGYVHRATGGDWVSRRGVFSRRNYGSEEQLPQVDGSGQEGQGRRFRVEGVDEVSDGVESQFGSPTAPVLENPEIQTRWYFKYFLGKVHQNYVGVDEEKTPFFMSVIYLGGQCKVILWRKTGAQKISLAATTRMPPKQILSHFPYMDKLDKNPKEIITPDIQKDLLLLEEQEGSVNFKFGVLYAKLGQRTDDEMLSNETGSPAFDEFLSLLGDRIRLKGWDKYKGGLDVKADMTGSDSVYTVYEGHEVMFHVSTLLPLSADKQQVERKRHIGNDIVNVVFVDDRLQLLNFDPSLVKSQFTHIFCVVARIPVGYQIAVYADDTVPPFGPALPSPPVFIDQQEFREFLLVKLINGEKATFNTPTFAQKRQRTLDLLIKDMYNDLGADAKESLLSRNSLTEMIVEPSKVARRKEEARQIEFIRFGQALKLQTIVKGDAPTSLATTGLYRRAPWEPHCVLSALPDQVICGDTWGDDLIIGTNSGVWLLVDTLSEQSLNALHNEHLPNEDHHSDQHIIVENVVTVRQLTACEAHGILLLRADKGRSGKMYVFRLSDFNTPKPAVKTKQDLKEHKLDRMKGCHLYAVSGPDGSRLRVVAAVGRKLVVMQWRHSAAYTAWCPATDTDTVEGFDYINELSLGESPTLMTLVDASSSTSDNLICVGYRHQYDVINERSGEVITCHSVDAARVTLVEAIQLPDDHTPHLLLCYNNTCHFHNARGCSHQQDFHWNMEPTAIVSAFPFVMAFSSDSLEIRLVINGSLVATLSLPSLSLVAAKNEILFATTAPELDDTPPRTPEGDAPTISRPLRLFCIRRRTLCGSPRGGRHLTTPTRPTLVTSSRLLVPEPLKIISRSCSSSPTANQPSFPT